jgi:hypothetical protein
MLDRAVKAVLVALPIPLAVVAVAVGRSLKVERVVQEAQVPVRTAPQEMMA